MEIKNTQYLSCHVRGNKNKFIDFTIDHLSFCLDFDVEGVDPGRKNAGDELSGKRIEEIKTRLS